MRATKRKTINIKALTAEAFDVGRKVALKHNDGVGYDRNWGNTPESTRKGFIAMVRFIVRRASLLVLVALCLAPAQRKGAEHGGQTLLRLSLHAAVESGQGLRVQPASGTALIISNLYSADFARSFVLRTNYPAPSPAAGPQESPVVKAVPISMAVASPPTNGPIVLPQFLYTNTPPNYWWHRLEADTPNGPWRTNDKNMTMPPSGIVSLIRTNKKGYFRMIGTPQPL